MSMSLYGDYIKERSQDLIMEWDFGFATYRYINDRKSVYIIDIFTAPAWRLSGKAAFIVEKVIEEAKSKGCTELLGTIVPSAHWSTESMKFQIAMGMKILSASNDAIIMRKDI